MNDITYAVSVDVNNPIIPYNVYVANVLDSNVRYLEITLYQNGNIIALSNEATATASLVTDNVLVDGSVECTISNNIISVPLEDLQRHGNLDVQVTVTEGEKVLAIPFPIQVRVTPNIAENAQIDENSLGSYAEVVHEIAEARGTYTTLHDALRAKAPLSTAYTFDSTTTEVPFDVNNPKIIYLNAVVDGESGIVITSAHNASNASFQIFFGRNSTTKIRYFTGGTSYSNWTQATESVDNKKNSITSSNRTSTDFYPSIKAVVDYLAANYLGSGDNTVSWANLAAAVQTLINGKESASNKLTSEAGIDEDSTDTKYPTAKAVFNFGTDILDEVAGDLVLKENLSNKKTTITGYETSNQFYPTIKALVDYVAANYENLSNKLSSEAGIDSNSTDTEYPSAKAVYDLGVEILALVNDDISNVESRLALKESFSNKKNAIAGNETSEQYYPTTKAVVDYLETYGEMYIDPTLSVQGKAADAKAVGDKLDGVPFDLTFTVNDVINNYVIVEDGKLRWNESWCSTDYCYVPLENGGTIEITSSILGGGGLAFYDYNKTCLRYITGNNASEYDYTPASMPQTRVFVVPKNTSYIRISAHKQPSSDMSRVSLLRIRKGIGLNQVVNKLESLSDDVVAGAMVTEDIRTMQNVLLNGLNIPFTESIVTPIYLKNRESVKITVTDKTAGNIFAYIDGHSSQSITISTDGVYIFTASFDGYLSLYTPLDPAPAANILIEYVSALSESIGSKVTFVETTDPDTATKNGTWYKVHTNTDGDYALFAISTSAQQAQLRITSSGTIGIRRRYLSNGGTFPAWGAFEQIGWTSAEIGAMIDSLVDPTLSVQGKAADAKATGDIRTKQNILFNTIYKTVNLAVEQGSIDTASGANVNSEKSVRTPSVIEKCMNVTFPETHVVRIFAYQGSTFVGCWSGTEFNKDWSKNLFMPSPVNMGEFFARFPDYSFRLAFVAASRTPITPADTPVNAQIEKYADKIPVYTVGTGGDFATFNGALIALANDSSEKIIEVKQGIYNIFEEYGGAEYIASLTDVDSLSWEDVSVIVPPNTTIRGIGNVVLEWNPTDSEIIDQKHAFLHSPLNLCGSCTIENIKIVCSNCRYGIHDEISGRAAFNEVVRKLKNVVVIYNASTYGVKYAYGAGHARRGCYRYENCTFSAHYGDVWSTHNHLSADTLTHATIEFVFCKFINNITNRPGNIRLSSTNANARKDSVYLNGCYANGISYGSEYSATDVWQNYSVTSMCSSPLTDTYQGRILEDHREPTTQYLTIS